MGPLSRQFKVRCSKFNEPYGSSRFQVQSNTARVQPFKPFNPLAPVKPSEPEVRDRRSARTEHVRAVQALRYGRMAYSGPTDIYRRSVQAVYRQACSYVSLVRKWSESQRFFPKSNL